MMPSVERDAGARVEMNQNCDTLFSDLHAVALARAIGCLPMELPTIDDCQVVELNRIADRRGNLSVIEAGIDVPFDIQRVYYLYDVPGGESRGGHAHRDLQQLIIAMSGAFDVVIDDGVRRRSVTLNRSYFGLLLPQLVWRELENFSSGSVCTVLASAHYDEGDYFRDYDEFVRFRQTQ